jgi:hypothetical protein
MRFEGSKGSVADEKVAFPETSPLGPALQLPLPGSRGSRRPLLWLHRSSGLDDWFLGRHL